MRVLRGRNVNDLYIQGRELLDREGVRSSNRSGDVMVCPFPVMSVYTHPCERVLFDASRDCNPFFHLMESIWMLSGSDDGRWLDQFVGDFSSRYGESDGHIHGGYGKRWRKWFTKWEENDECDESFVIDYQLDQLTEVIKLLRKNPDDRRVVIQMWSPVDDLGTSYKDVPCNTQCYPRIVDGRLDLTVMCRSNDIIWGAYGANAVHFSVLQEYLAAGTGSRVGILYQLSNNFHAYVDVMAAKPLSREEHVINPYQQAVYPLPMFDNFEYADEDIHNFVNKWNGGHARNYHNQWFTNVVMPMRTAHAAWKNKDRAIARSIAENVAAPDWRRAALEWIDRRTK